MNKTLVCYCYYEQNDVCIENLLFFIKNGIINSPKYFYIMIVNGEKISAQIPNYNNIRILNRQNRYHIGGDFRGWSQALETVKIQDFKYYIFLNSTVRGPFIPRYIPNSMTWLELFTNKLTNKIKLVGPTVNYQTRFGFKPHIQSSFFCTDITGLNLLIKNNIFTNFGFRRDDIIKNHELKITKVILDDGYDFFAFQLSENINHHKFVNGDYKNLNGDIQYPEKYYGITLNPLEIIFIKTNRINDSYVERYTDFNS
jgi:hypothetical protein